MEMLKKRWVAVVILLLVIALSICIGLMKAPTGTGQPAVDQAQSPGHRPGHPVLYPLPL